MIHISVSPLQENLLSFQNACTLRFVCCHMKLRLNEGVNLCLWAHNLYQCYFSATDRCATDEGKKRVDYAQASVVAALGVQLSNSHRDDPQALAKCLLLLADLRFFTDRIVATRMKLAKAYGLKKDDLPPLTQKIMCPISKNINTELADRLSEQCKCDGEST